MSVDVDIYMSNIIKFFKQHPKDLMNLVPLEKEDEFYQRIREVANENHEKGSEVGLTQKQLIDICRELNGKPPEKKINTSNLFFRTNLGMICLN